MRRDDRFDEIDKAALRSALLADGVCPKCRRDLRPAVDPADGLGCVTCDEVYPEAYGNK